MRRLPKSSLQSTRASTTSLRPESGGGRVAEPQASKGRFRDDELVRQDLRRNGVRSRFVVLCFWCGRTIHGLQRKLRVASDFRRHPSTRWLGHPSSRLVRMVGSPPAEMSGASSINGQKCIESCSTRPINAIPRLRWKYVSRFGRPISRCEDSHRGADSYCGDAAGASAKLENAFACLAWQRHRALRL